MNKVKVITKRPNEKPKVEDIENEYEALYNYVLGLIDYTYLPKREDIDIIVNDSSLILGMDANIVLPEYEGVLAGPIIFAAHNENGDMISLNDEQIDYILKYIDKNQVFNMSLERAFQYSRIIKPLRECEDELGLE